MDFFGGFWIPMGEAPVVYQPFFLISLNYWFFKLIVHTTMTGAELECSDVSSCSGANGDALSEFYEADGINAPKLACSLFALIMGGETGVRVRVRSRVRVRVRVRSRVRAGLPTTTGWSAAAVVKIPTPPSSTCLNPTMHPR